MFSVDEYKSDQKGAGALSPTKSTSSTLPSPTSSISPVDRTTARSRIQIIDENKKFTPDLEAFLQSDGNSIDLGMNYNVIAVFGSQSTGKSTLLNRLFGTTFDVMDEKKRSQTTKGIWLANEQASNRSILVLDLEGTDGRERGEDQDFERKSSLFALAIAEVVIINMWENAVGLYHGANMALLKTVLEAHLQLFQKEGSPKTHLFFVIRDHCSDTPLSSLAETLSTDIKTMWASLNAAHPMENYFTLSFASLPHKRLLPDAFERDVLKLRERFVLASHPQCAFKAEFQKQVPLDGFPRYSATIWEQIQEHADLDVPTQQELLAQFRCDALMEQAERAFLEQLKTIAQDQVAVEGHVLDGFLTEALDVYDHQAKRYNAAIYTKTREGLVQRMRDHHGIRVFENGIRKVHQKVLAQFPEALELHLKDAKFHEAVRRVRHHLLTFFKTQVQRGLMKEAAWNTEDMETLFSNELEELVQVKNKQVFDEQLEVLLRRFKRDLVENLESLFRQKNPPPDFAGKVNGLLEHLQKTALQELNKICEDVLEVDPVPWEGKIRETLLAELTQTLEQATQENVLIPRLRVYFEELFRFDADGLPRFWKPSDDMAAVYRHARSVVMRHLTQLSRYTVPGCNSALLDEKRLAEITARFKLEADVMYMEAKRSLLLVSPQIPKWMILVMLALGWNEIMYLLSSPFLLLVVLLALAALYLLIWTGLAGPLLHVFNKLSSEISTHLVQRFVVPITQPTGHRRETIKSPQFAMVELNQMKKGEASE